MSAHAHHDGTASSTTPVLGVHLDLARKYFSPSWILRLLAEMTALGFNELQLHLSDNEGFRLESRRHPEVVSARHLTQAELFQVIQAASDQGISIVPALDVPGHMRHVLDAHPELRVDGSPAGAAILDYSQPRARRLVTELVEELAPLFPGDTWHLGGDEVFPLSDVQEVSDLHRAHARLYPGLLRWAREVCEAREEATVLDGYTAYLNTVVDTLHSLGKTQVRAWNDALAVEGTTQRLHPQVDVMYWSGWHPSFPTVRRLVDLGHRVINANDALYYVLTTPGRAYATKPTVQDVEAWHPGVFSPHSVAGDQTWSAPLPQWDLGTYLCIWCDVPQAEQEDEVLEGVLPLMRALSSRFQGQASPR